LSIDDWGRTCGGLVIEAWGAGGATCGGLLIDMSPLIAAPDRPTSSRPKVSFSIRRMGTILFRHYLENPERLIVVRPIR